MPQCELPVPFESRKGLERRDGLIHNLCNLLQRLKRDLAIPCLQLRYVCLVPAQKETQLALRKPRMLSVFANKLVQQFVLKPRSLPLEIMYAVFHVYAILACQPTDLNYELCITTVEGENRPESSGRRME